MAKSVVRCSVCRGSCCEHYGARFQEIMLVKHYAPRAYFENAAVP